MTTHRVPHPGDELAPEHCPATTAAGPEAHAEEKAVTDYRTDDRAQGGIRPASAHSNNSGDRMLRIRRRVADGAYDNAAVIALVARALVDSGDLR